MDVDRCVICGAPVPEGRMVCWQCEHRDKEESRRIQMDENKKPRLCELLGVEVGEEWTVEDGSTVYRIDEDGDLLYQTSDGDWICAYGRAWNVLSVLNGKSKITRRSRWTEKDVEDAKAAQQLFPYGNMLVGIGCTGAAVLRADGSIIAELANWCFPSVRPGEDVPLDKILEAAP